MRQIYKEIRIIKREDIYIYIYIYIYREKETDGEREGGEYKGKKNKENESGRKERISDTVREKVKIINCRRYIY